MNTSCNVMRMRVQSVHMRAYRWYALMCFGACILTSMPAVAQDNPQGILPDDPPDAFLVDVLSFASTSSPLSRIDAFVQVGYSIMTFVKQDDRYSASMDLAITVYDSAGGLVSEKSWTDEIAKVTFDESVSAQRHTLDERTFEVAPGLYQVTISAADRESKLVRRTSRKIIVPKYVGRGFALSSIMLVSRLTTSGEKQSIVPAIGGNVGNLGDIFYAFFEAYGDREQDSIRFASSISNMKGDVLLRADTVMQVHRGRNGTIIRVNRSNLVVGDYTLTINAYPAIAGPDSASASIAATYRLIGIRWENLPLTVKDLDLAIQQVQYIAKDDEMDSLKAAKTSEEKQKRFLAFWKKRDPNPNTTRNERMEEYYRRVDYANRHFSHYHEGWKSDMGMVYIMFGPPSNIDRHPYEMDSKPYEIWMYDTLNYQFVFVDESGFGEYRLITPLNDIWRRRDE